MLYSISRHYKYPTGISYLSKAGRIGWNSPFASDHFTGKSIPSTSPPNHLEI
jgi:hypothetical protein